MRARQQVACANPCLTCGTTRTAIMRCRVIRETMAQLRSAVQPTQFVWQHVWALLTSAQPDEGVYLCAPCGQWLRRVSEAGGPKRPLPVDQLIHACLQIPESDEFDAHARRRLPFQRCVYARLVAALREPGNRVIMCAPPLARTIILHHIKAQSAHPNLDLALTWWYVFGQPEFMPNLEVARAVRVLR